MNRILLDTSAYSGYLRGNGKIREVIRHADDISVTPIILGELLEGFRKGTARAKNEKELNTFLASPRVAIMNLDQETADCYAEILNSLWMRGRPIPTNDLWIASSAMQYGLTVITTDKHFGQIGQIRVKIF